MIEEKYFWCPNCYKVYSKQEWENQGMRHGMTCPGCHGVSFFDKKVMQWSALVRIHFLLHPKQSEYPVIPEKGKKYPR